MTANVPHDPLSRLYERAVHDFANRHIGHMFELRGCTWMIVGDHHGYVVGENEDERTEHFLMESVQQALEGGAR